MIGRYYSGSQANILPYTSTKNKEHPLPNQLDLLPLLPPPSKNKTAHRFHGSCEELLRGNRSVVDRVITRVGLRVVWHTSWYMYAVYAPVRYLRKQTSWLSLGGKMAVHSFHFCRPCLTSWFVAKIVILTRIDAQDTVVAGLQAALTVTAFERLLERSRVSEWPCFRLSNCPDNHTRSVQQ